MEYYREPSQCEGVGTTGHGAEEDYGIGEDRKQWACSTTDWERTKADPRD